NKKTPASAENRRRGCSTTLIRSVPVHDSTVAAFARMRMGRRPTRILANAATRTWCECLLDGLALLHRLAALDRLALFDGLATLDGLPALGALATADSRPPAAHGAAPRGTTQPPTHAATDSTAATSLGALREEEAVIGAVWHGEAGAVLEGQCQGPQAQ